jgi:hypothetical protein
MSDLPSSQSRYPGHSWGPFAEDPSLDVGITGQALADAVRTAWLEAGGTEETFGDTFPHLAESMTRQATPA